MFHLLNAPFKHHCKCPKEQGVKDMVNDLRLLPNSSILKPQVEFHRLTTATNSKADIRGHNYVIMYYNNGPVRLILILSIPT